MESEININLKELQQKELEIFKEFIRVSEKLHLKYFIIGGTLLGTVRHQGFIPWDDDIDIGMPRKDYEQFIRNGYKYLDNNYFIQTIDSDSEYLMGFAKLRDSNTTLVEKAVKKRKINHGVYIDIFPLDGIPNSKVRRRVDKSLLTLYQTKISTFFFEEVKKSENLKGKLYKFISNVTTFGKTSNEILGKIDRLVRRYDYDKSHIVGNYYGAWGEKEVCPKEYFGEGTKLLFEGIEVNAPEKYDIYLKKIYGDYMQLPPLNKQKSHHDFEILDLNRSYLEND